MTADFTIRCYEPNDRDAAWRVLEAALVDADAFFGGDGLDEDFREIEGTVVATGAFRPPAGVVANLLPDLDESTAELKRMHVLPEHQRRGYGRRMLAELEQHARDRSHETLVLVTTDRQAAACAFYESAGFELLRADEVEAFGEAFEARSYRKSL